MNLLILFHYLKIMMYIKYEFYKNMVGIVELFFFEVKFDKTK